MLNKKIFFLVFLLFLQGVIADDIYILSFDASSKQCILKKNGKNIPFFDKRFKKKAPHNSYTCYSIQKEQYKDCKIIRKKNITALFMGYGAYEYTNAILSFKNINKDYDSYVKIKCSKTKVYDYSK